MRRLFGTDGVRGIANEMLTCEMAMNIGRATAGVLVGREKNPLVLVGMDTRISSVMLANSIIAGLSSVGSDSVNLGVVPTPAVAYLVTKYKADAGIMISASHNSYEYNGIKIFNSDGYKLADELEERIESIVLDGNPPIKIAQSDRIGRTLIRENATEDYIQHLLMATDVDFSGIKIAIDCANGSSSTTAHRLFSKLGAQCYMLSDKPNGININDKCGSTHLENLKKYVVEHSLDAGLAFDGDADRFLCVDEKGNEIDGDMVMAVLSLDMKKRGVLRNNTVVGTVMTNYGFGIFCKENDINFIPAKVGDRYVLEELIAGDYNFGGEQSGHVILKDYATTGDGQLTAVKLLSLMKRKNQQLSEIVSVIKKYPQHMVNIKVTPEAKLAFFTDPDIKDLLSSVKERLDGHGRILVRPSGTEALLRVMIEGENLDETIALTEDTANRIAKKLEKYS